MPVLYSHPDNGYVGGLCAPRDFHTRTEITSRDGFYARPRARISRGVLVCDYCGSALLTTVGFFHVVEWRGDGRYHESDSLIEYASRSAAERRAESLGTDYVVRAW